MKNIRIFYLKNCHFLVVKFSVYLNRRVFVMSVPTSDPFGDNLFVMSNTIFVISLSSPAFPMTVVKI